MGRSKRSAGSHKRHKKHKKKKSRGRRSKEVLHQLDPNSHGGSGHKKKRRSRRSAREGASAGAPTRRSGRRHKGSADTSGSGRAARAIPIEGLSKSSLIDTRYPTLAMETSNFGIETWLPDHNQDLNATDVITFSRKSRKGCLWRFGVDPIRLTFRAGYKATAQATTLSNLRPKTKAPHVFLEGALGAASFFEKVDVIINGWKVSTEQMGDHGYIFQTFNRTYMTEERRKKKYGRPIPRVSTSFELKADHANGDKQLPALAKSMEPLESADDTTETHHILHFGVDGVWPFDTQSNVMWALTGEEGANGYLPPEMDITLRFHKRKPARSLVQRAGQADTEVYRDAAASAVVTDDSTEFTISDMRLQYEVLTTNPADMAARQKQSTFFVDVPRVSLDAVAPDLMLTHNEVYLPAGAKFVALAWMWSDHVFLQEAKLRPLSPRFAFPPNATNVVVGFEGEPGLLFERGFEELGTDKAAASFTSREYHSRLVHLGLYSREYSKMFPKVGTRSYDQVLLFDLGAHKLDTPTKLHVKVKYADGAQGKKGYFLCSMVVQQYEYTYRDGDELKWKLVL